VALIPAADDDRVAPGCMLLVALHLLLIAAVAFLLSDSKTVPWPVRFIGLVQVVYLVPLLIVARRRGLVAFEKGLWIAAALTVLLNAVCALP
jgi:lysylphosphatidylglycerol synthetase-like protein (DUF2156 family)